VERILVIHDDPGSYQPVQSILEGAGYDVTITASDQIAVNRFRATRAGLIILDVRIPGKSSQDLCRLIRDKSENVSILVLTAIRDIEEAVLHLKLGVDDYITKPFDSSEFLARVRAALRCRESINIPSETSDQTAKDSANT
jgi:DNA-binding response OmpR family regulator